MRHYYIFSILLSFLAHSFVANAQKTDYEDAIYLKTGVIIYGTITENIPNKSATIKTEDGNVLTNEWSEIYKITKVLPGQAKRMDTGFYEKGTRMSGFFNITEVNTGIAFQQGLGSDVSAVSSVPYGFHDIFGYLINPRFSIGAGIEYDKCDSFSFVPMFVDLRLYSGANSNPIVFAIDIGGSFETNPDTGGDLGGFFCSLSIGEKIKLGKKTFFIISGAYTHQSFITPVTGTTTYTYAALAYFKLNLGFALN